MRRVLLAASLLLALALAADATILKRLTIEEVESHANEVFVGTVRSTKSVKDEGPRKLIFTEVTFEDLTVYKGALPVPTVTYRFAGGTIGDRRLTVEGVPEFEVGRRYVLFMNAELDWISPAVGWGQGRYEVKGKGEGRYVCDSDGRPVFRFVDGFPVVTPRREGEKPMSLSAFRGMIEEIIERREAPPEREEREEEKGGVR